MEPRERSFWQYKVYADIRGGSLPGEAALNENEVVPSLKMAIFASFVYCLPKRLSCGHKCLELPNIYGHMTAFT